MEATLNGEIAALEAQKASGYEKNHMCNSNMITYHNKYIL